MQKVKQIFSNDKDETSPRSSVSGSNNAAGYSTTDGVTNSSGEHSNLSKNWAQGALGNHGNTHEGSGLNQGTGTLTGDRNIHSGSTGVGSNIGRDTNEISGGHGLGNAATGAGSHTGTLTGDRNVSGTNRDSQSGGIGQKIVDKISGNHSIGHDSRDTTKFDPTGENTHHDHKHLQAVTHETHRHMEVEEVQRERNVDRHVHHLQHHVQPVKDQHVKDEVIHKNIHPTTNIAERHVNTDEDVKLFHGLGEKHRDQETHLPKERTVVDLGEKVNTNTHHHVHHVTQPVVEREVHDRHRIHTVIPLSHTVHEAPIIHKSSLHEPVHMSDFLKGGGKLDSGITHDKAGILSTGDCDREVDGIGEKLVKDLNLKPSTFGSHGSNTSGINSGSTGLNTGSNTGLTGSHGTTAGTTGSTGRI